ncbi:MAG: hypothetical protein VB071_08000 [Lawsonibacter sp.]|nr:hypothetical protein [Lawsonibacter sp.]
MEVQFCEKLDFLMRLTNSTNSALSLSIKLDASHISRLRRGQRGALKDLTCIQSMAAYFARNCKEDYQRKALADVLHISPSSFDGDTLALHISNWLTSKLNYEAAAVKSFLAGFSNVSSRQTMPRVDQPKKAPLAPPPADTSVFYGVEGKRQASLYFLSEVIVQNKPQTLLLFSDEATDWMTESAEFAAKWTLLMTQLLSKGNHIKIIHTVSRDLDEMLSAIRQWMPLYMTGLLESYFYPKKRDGIYKHTRFVCPGVAAVVSSSVGTSMDCAANMFLRDKHAIQAYAEEFCQYLSLCKPLMRIYTAKDTAAYFETLLEYETETSDSLIKTESLSLLTMPESLVSGILARMDLNGFDLRKLQRRRKQLFEASLMGNSFTEFAPMFTVEQVKRGAAKVAFSVMLLGDAASYTLEEYILHLEHLQSLLTHYDHFHLHLVKDEAPINYMVYAREALGAIVGKTSAPSVALAINETNLATAFWDYLKSMLGEKACQRPNNEESAKKLSDYIRQLKQGFEPE